MRNFIILSLLVVGVTLVFLTGYQISKMSPRQLCEMKNGANRMTGIRPPADCTYTERQKEMRKYLKQAFRTGCIVGRVTHLNNFNIKINAINSQKILLMCADEAQHYLDTAVTFEE